MSFASFVPAVWGQALSRVAPRGISPLVLLAGAGLALSTPTVQAQEYREGQVLVRTSAIDPDEPTMSASELESTASVAKMNTRLQARLNSKFPGSSLRKNFSNSGWAVVKVPAGSTTNATLNALEAKLGTENVMADVRLKPTVAPNDPQYGSQYWLPKISAPTAWDITKGSNSVVVAVIDTGAQLDHPDLKNNLWVNPGEIPNNGKDDDGNGYIDDVYGINTVPGEENTAPNDDDGHGTFCSGVVGASTNNGTQVAGVNWNVKVMPLRFMNVDGGYTSDAIECLEYVIKMKKKGINVRVTSNSWGPDPSDSTGGNSPALKSAFQAAGSAGILNICAAGNGDVNNNAINIDVTPQYPASYDDASIVSVAASDENDNPTYFSNYGATSVDLAAPGDHILGIDLNSTTAFYSGTSMSTPMVAGAAALLLSKETGFTAAQVKERILATVDKLPQWSGKTVTGGRLNLTRMLTGATNELPTISGQVYREVLGSRLPIVGATLTLKVGSSTKATATSGTDGTYAFRNLPAATYKITPKFTGYKFTTQTVTLSASSNDVTLDFMGTSTKKLYVVTGQALGSDNLPRAGVEIYQATNKGNTLLATTDADGKYVIYDRPAGTYRLIAKSSEFPWVADPLSIKLPAKTGTSAPNGVVNFNADVTPPSITITTPSDNTVVKVNSAPKVTIVATDNAGVDHIYYTLTNTTGSLQFYNWKTKKWTTNSLETGVTFDKDVSGTSVKLQVTLPKLTAGSYFFQTWAKDDSGNTTLAGNETTITIFSGTSSSGNSTSTSSTSVSTTSVNKS